VESGEPPQFTEKSAIKTTEPASLKLFIKIHSGAPFVHEPCQQWSGIFAGFSRAGRIDPAQALYSEEAFCGFFAVFWPISPIMEKTYAIAAQSNISRYVHETFQPEDDSLREIRANMERNNLPAIQVGPMDGLHLEVLIRAFNVRKAVEIGTLGGYSGTCIARALPENGKLYTLEIDSKHVRVARENFRVAQVENKIEILQGPALESLTDLASKGPFDLVFIDADKVNYPAYLAWAAENLRIGGVVLGDNTFAFGMIGDEKIEDAEDRETVQAIRNFNWNAARGGRFRATLLPTGEGLTVAVKIK
jgi:caffeoyl-CoA O-methyltransferase